MTDSPDRTSGDRHGGSQHADLVAEVIQDQKRRQEVREKSQRPPGGGDTPFFLQVSLLVTGTLFFYLLFFSPTWIAPTAPPEIAAEKVEANLKFYVYMLIKRVEAYEEANGMLPTDLAAIPGVKPGTEYVRLTSTDYRIRYTDDELTITYQSSQPPEDFLGDAGGWVLGGAEGASGAAAGGGA